MNATPPTAAEWAQLTSQGFVQAICGIVVVAILGFFAIAIRVYLTNDRKRTEEWQRQFDLTREDHREDMIAIRADSAAFRETISAGFREMAGSVRDVLNHLHHPPHAPHTHNPPPSGRKS